MQDEALLEQIRDSVAEAALIAAYEVGGQLSRADLVRALEGNEFEAAEAHATLIDLGLAREDHSLGFETTLTSLGRSVAARVCRSRTVGPDRWDAVQRAIAAAPTSWREVEVPDGPPISEAERALALDRLERWNLVAVLRGDDTIVSVRPRDAILEVPGIEGRLADHYEGRPGPMTSTVRTKDMAADFKIDRQGIQRMTREIQREFDKHPIQLSVEADPQSTVFPAPAVTTVNYNGPVVHVTGDHAQLAWANGSSHQAQDRVEQIAPGLEDLAKLLATLVAMIPQLGLADGDTEVLRAEVDSLLGQVTTTEPDQGALRRGITMIKGLLAPVMVGAGAGVTAETAEFVRTTIEQLGHALAG